MVAVIDGVVRDLSKDYADGTPNFEIHVPMDRADGLPYQIGERVKVSVNIGGVEYQAGLRATTENKYAWVCPDLYASDGQRLKLGRLLIDAGYKANDQVHLLADGTLLTIHQRV